MVAKKAATPKDVVVDPEPIAAAAATTSSPIVVGPDKRVRITRNVGSVEAGGGHYTLRAGAIMVLGQQAADELIAQRMAEEL